MANILKNLQKFTFGNLLIMLCAVGFGCFFICMPKHGDDFWYMEPFRDWFLKQGILYPEDGGNIFTAGFPWRDIKYCWKYHWIYDNMRFCNMAVAVMLLFPKWVGGAVVAISWTLAMKGSQLLMQSERHIKTALPIFLAIIMWVVLFPWYDMMGSEVYEFNYVVSSGLGISLCVWLRSYSASRGNLIAITIFSFILGGWQECFSFPILCGILASLPLLSGEQRKCRIYSACALSAGLVWLLCSPHYQDFLIGGGAKSAIALPGWGEILLLAIRQPAFWVMSICMVAIALRGKWNVIWESPIYRLLLVSAFVSMLLPYFTKPLARVSWWADVASVILTIRALEEIWFSLKRDWPIEKIRKMRIACIILEIGLFVMGIIFAWTTAVDSLRFRDNFHTTITDYLNGKDEPTNLCNENIYILTSDDVNDFYSPIIKERRFFPHDKQLELALADFEDVARKEGSSADMLKGNLSAFRLNRLLMAPAERIFPGIENRTGDESQLSNEEMYTWHELEYDFGAFKTIDTSLVILFRSRCDGKWRVILIPEFEMMHPFVRFIEIQGIATPTISRETKN